LVVNIPVWEDYVSAYHREGFIVIPNHSSESNPKSLGYHDWQTPREYPLENLLSEILATKKASALLGYNTADPSKPIWAVDIDLVKCLCEDTSHVKNSNHSIACVALAREWRRNHFSDFRNLVTEVSLTVHGGIHAFFKASDKNAVLKAMAPVLSIDSRIFIEEIKGRGRQVLLPPSRIADGTYFLLDCKGPRYLAEDFKIRELL